MLRLVRRFYVLSFALILVGLVWWAVAALILICAIEAWVETYARSEENARRDAWLATCNGREELGNDWPWDDADTPTSEEKNVYSTFRQKFERRSEWAHRRRTPPLLS